MPNLGWAGKAGGPDVRLLYPRLEPGETGSGTFRIRLSFPAKVRRRGDWKGPWQDPYWTAELSDEGS